MTPTTHKPMLAEAIGATLRRVGVCRTVGDRVTHLKSLDIPIFRRVLEYAYNPYRRFGVIISPSTKEAAVTAASPIGGLDIDEPDIWTLLDYFTASTHTSTTKTKALMGLAPRLNRITCQILLGIIEKSAVTGVAASTVNKAFPDLIPTFAVQLANKYTDRKVKEFPCYVEPKYDGMRSIAQVWATGEVQVVSRTGREIPAAASFHDDLRVLGLSLIKHYSARDGMTHEGVVIDGELEGDTFADTISVFRSSGVATSGQFRVFDAVPMKVLTDPKYQSPIYTARRKALTGCMPIAPTPRLALTPSYQVSSRRELWDMYTQARAMGLEGLIVKSGQGLWTKKRSNDWLKIKAEETADLRIIGAFEGTGEMEGTLGGLIVDRAGVEVRVGSGFTHADREAIWAMFLRDMVRINEGSDDYELLGCLAEVQYQEVTPDGSLRHPVFIRLRTDKDEVSY